uniref:Phasin domain-containing protein n=1 Tax=Zooxanthella nutricula TaxID=1333877 RepID=A0A7S2KLU1_9DINO
MARLPVLLATLGLADCLHQLPRFARLGTQGVSLLMNDTELNASRMSEPSGSTASTPARSSTPEPEAQSQAPPPTPSSGTETPSEETLAPSSGTPTTSAGPTQLPVSEGQPHELSTSRMRDRNDAPLEESPALANGTSTTAEGPKRLRTSEGKLQTTPAPQANMTDDTPMAPPNTTNSSRDLAGRMSSASEEAAYASVLAKQAESFAQEYRKAKAKAAQYALEVVEAAKVVRRASREAVNASEFTAGAAKVVNGEAEFINGTNITLSSLVAEEAARTAREAAENVDRALASFRGFEADAKRAAAKGLGVAKIMNASINRTLQFSYAASKSLETPMAAAKRIIVAPTTLFSSTSTTTVATTTSITTPSPMPARTLDYLWPGERSQAHRHAGQAVLGALALVAASTVATGFLGA